MLFTTIRRKAYIWNVHLLFLEGAAFCNNYPVPNFIKCQVWLHIQIEPKIVFITQLHKEGKNLVGKGATVTASLPLYKA